LATFCSTMERDFARARQGHDRHRVRQSAAGPATLGSSSGIRWTEHEGAAENRHRCSPPLGREASSRRRAQNGETVKDVLDGALNAPPIALVIARDQRVLVYREPGKDAGSL
jgi:hypothetical protein